MAEQALKVRTATNEALSKELASARSEKSEVRPGARSTARPGWQLHPLLALYGCAVGGAPCLPSNTRPSCHGLGAAARLTASRCSAVPTGAPGGEDVERRPGGELLPGGAHAGADGRARRAQGGAGKGGAGARAWGGSRSGLAHAAGAQRAMLKRPPSPFPPTPRNRAAQAQRERDYLATENELLRQEVLEGAERGEEGSAALQLLARQGEELRRAEQRSAALENDNVQLQARVSALERAHTAQATAMLSCLEESERVRLQQLTVTVPESPVGPLAAHHGGRHSEFTDDSCAAGPAGAPPGFPDALAALGSDCGSFVSCITPLTTGSSSGAPGSIFHSPEPSPDPAHQQQQQGKRPPVPGGSTAVGIGKA